MRLLTLKVPRLTKDEESQPGRGAGEVVIPHVGEVKHRPRDYFTDFLPRQPQALRLARSFADFVPSLLF